jgi:hypothetical protein
MRRKVVVVELLPITGRVIHVLAQSVVVVLLDHNPAAVVTVEARLAQVVMAVLVELGCTSMNRN